MRSMMMEVVCQGNGRYLVIMAGMRRTRRILDT